METTPPQASAGPRPEEDALIHGDELWARLHEPDLILLDVRDPDEYADWHIQGSVNVPLDEVLNGAPLPAGGRDGDGPVVTVCASGQRSEVARQHLAARGYRVRNLADGLLGWTRVYDAVPVPGAPEGVEVLQFRRVGKGCLSYLIVKGDEAAVVDPTLDIQVYAKAAAERGARITAVLDTHAHADHVSGAGRLTAAHDAVYHAPAEVGEHHNHHAVQDRDVIVVGDVGIEVLATPGHTPESVTYRLGNLLFTGDTLFIESVGRPDLGQDPSDAGRVLWRSLHERVLSLDDDRVVLPGHFGEDQRLDRDAPWAARLGDLRKDLDALERSEDAFVAWVAANAIPKPANFGRIKDVNRGRSRESFDELDLRWLEAGPNRCAVSGIADAS